MEKLDMQTENIADKNFETLSKMFPNAITETINENGEIVRAIDADVLRQEISGSIVEGKEDRYQFTWPDKKKAILLANEPISKTLRLDRNKSMGRDGLTTGIDSKNIYIEGDNFEAIKLLQETYLGKIDLIYIDPPYNTGKDVFVYDDDRSISKEEFAERSGQFDDIGNILYDIRSNNEGSGRFHTDWLNMLYPRLKLAKNLLSEIGSIFISIDDNELDNLLKICNEIFGEDCFVSTISWQKVYSPKNNNVGISAEVEYVVCYSKNPDWIAGKLERTEKMNSMYKNPDNDPEGSWTSSDATAPGANTHQGMVYAIQSPFTGEYIYPTRGCCWRKFQDDLLDIMNGWASYKLEDLHDEEQRANVCGISPESVRKGVKGIVLNESLSKAKETANKKIEEGNWPLFYFTKGGEGGLRKKTYLKDMEGRTATNLWTYSEVGHNDEAKKEVASLFDGHAPFDTPKPVRMISRIIRIGAKRDSIIMDFFSGSATLAQAVMSNNANNEYENKYILVQLQEKSNYPGYDTLCDIGEERIRRSAKKIKEETGAEIDYGFRVFRVDTSNMKEIYYRPADTDQSLLDMFADNIKPDRTPEDLLFQVMLDLGVLLSSKIEETEIAGKKVFNVADGFLIACFDNDVTDETIKAVANLKPYYAVFRDSSMRNDSVATNFDQIFANISPDTIRKVL